MAMLVLGLIVLQLNYIYTLKRVMLGTTQGDNIGSHTLTEYLRFTGHGDSGDINSVSVGFKLGQQDGNNYNPDGRLDICINQGTYGGSNMYGSVPDNTVATFLGNGNVGIGTDDPSSKLEIIWDGTILTLNGDHSNIYFQSNAVSSGWGVYHTTTDTGYSIKTNSTSRNLVLGCGNRDDITIKSWRQQCWYWNR